MYCSYCEKSLHSDFDFDLILLKETGHEDAQIPNHRKHKQTHPLDVHSIYILNRMRLKIEATHPVGLDEFKLSKKKLHFS